jgi:hypothetical protein
MQQAISVHRHVWVLSEGDAVTEFDSSVCFIRMYEIILSNRGSG